MGAPGSGKSAAWKALVAATHGPEALAAGSGDVLHVYTELLPSPRLQVGRGVPSWALDVANE